MKKYLIIGMIGAVALVVIGKKTNAWSYFSTAVGQIGSSAKDQVPTKFELERLRNEIAALDGDIGQMVRPIAEQKTSIDKLRKDIAKGQATIEKTKKVLLETVEELEANPSGPFVRDDIKFSPDQVRRQLAVSTERLKQLEKTITVQQEVLAAKELSFRAMKDQVTAVVTKKREYEVRLAELEAAEESLQLSRIETNTKLDTGRLSVIEEAFAGLEKRHADETNANILKKGELIEIPLGARKTTTADLQSIRSYLEGASTEPAVKGDKTVTTK